MPHSEKLIQKKRNLKKKYIQLIEEAYNLKQTEPALSDVAEFEATLVLNKINKLKFVIVDTEPQLI
ncbi:Lacal_2735 family protein [uncultured Winogradskyella sp.]|uniref:Lacal_2735 family protein n=1 Tax=uncultured Winogradskyella sp. TaxID=395353 RepID=UPI0030DA8C4D|tara:strand:- start:33341 stop:33538 length:198 start_codon:yes stop_codon:yes gene_type:complete